MFWRPRTTPALSLTTKELEAGNDVKPIVWKKIRPLNTVVIHETQVEKVFISLHIITRISLRFYAITRLGFKRVGWQKTRIYFCITRQTRQTTYRSCRTQPASLRIRLGRVGRSATCVFMLNLGDHARPAGWTYCERMWSDLSFLNTVSIKVRRP